MRLVFKEGYSFKSACVAVGMCAATLLARHAKFAPPPESCGDDATVEELDRKTSGFAKCCDVRS